MAKKKGGGGEQQISKSPAEFFAENAQIAGFDNLGKSMFTSIRELMENSLDACESIGELPSIKVEINELTLAEFNKRRGISYKTTDTELFASKKQNASAKKETKYFQITCRDNGCGMQHEAIPNLLGRVLSGSKYGVRQTRGKFGLGAKMALIWSKKSTGVPIKVTTAHRPKEGSKTPSHVSFCELDIDITKNEPKILEHKKTKNSQEWVGTELELLIAGNWTTYKAKIVQYLQQLAIITPYAELELVYTNNAEPKRNITLKYDRRSEQMPAPAKEVKHHVSSVNNLVISQLIERTKQMSLSQFLTKDLAGISLDTAKRLVVECGWDDEEMSPQDLSDRDITQLVQKLRSCTKVKNPDGTCLSPLGEYNLNLGIRKVLEPEYLATARDKPSAYEGHPFLVEAAVCLGGKTGKEGISVVRFANRIPLLFEGGADVSTRVAMTKIKWSSYKIDHKRDKIGVFVSIVSTKIPYKGTGKEYIGDDITAISASVKRALQSCCQQLKTHLMKRNALRDQQTRKSRLAKYIPDVTRSLFGLLEQMSKRASEGAEENPSPRKRTKSEPALDANEVKQFADQIKSGQLHADMIKKSLEEAINSSNIMTEEEQSEKAKKMARVPLFIDPMFSMENSDKDIEHPLFVFRPIRAITP